MQACATYPNKDETIPKWLSQGRTAKAIGCRFHLYYIRQWVVISSFPSPKEEWKMVNLFWLSGTQQSHQEVPFPFSLYRPSLGWLAGKKLFSFFGGFSGYNQIQISPEDQDKTTFTFPWGTFTYRVLPFGLCNAPTTFQRDVLNIIKELEIR